MFYNSFFILAIITLKSDFLATEEKHLKLLFVSIKFNSRTNLFQDKNLIKNRLE